MSQSETARRMIAEVSAQDVDAWVRPLTFTKELEESVRGHIHEELVAWMVYRKLAADCSRSNICLHGFAMLFGNRAVECLTDVRWLEKYLVTRGGRSKPTAIEAPKFDWPDSPVEPIAPCREALSVEKRILEDLERLCALAERCGESSLADALQGRFLRKQARQVKDLGDLLQQVARVSKEPGAGLYMLDRELRHSDGAIPWSSQNDPDLHDLLGRHGVKGGGHSGGHGAKALPL